MEIDKVLSAMVVALAFNELVHITFEIWGIRQKVGWLTARMDKKPHGEWPLNIDSLIKTLLLHSVMFIFFTGLAMAFFSLINISVSAMMQISIVLLVVTYSFTVLGMDAFHDEIGQLIKRYKRVK